MTKYLITVYTILFISFPLYASYMRTIDYDQIKQEGGFRSPRLRDVATINSSQTNFSQTDKNDLFGNKNLTSLRTLDLKNQNMSDNDIYQLTLNPSLRRIINIDLSNNPLITNQSIYDILHSNLGSIRDLPQISGRFGIPSSTIYVKAGGTSILDDKNQPNNFTLHRFRFPIDYIHPYTEQPTDIPVEEGVKFVEVSFW